MLKKLVIISSLFLSAPVFGATICVDIPDEQIPFVQAVATREKAESVQVYLQSVVTSAVNSWQKQLEDDKLQKMKEMLQSLSSAAQSALILALQAKAVQEGVTP